MKTKILLISTLLFTTIQLTSAQVLYSENFDNLTLGNVSSDFTGATPGQGSWHTKSQAYSVIADAGNNYFKIVTEPNKGKVLQIMSLPSLGINQLQKRGLDILWSNRAAGNNILKIQYDFFTGPNMNTGSKSIGMSVMNDITFSPTSTNPIMAISYRPDLGSLNPLAVAPHFLYLSTKQIPDLRNTWINMVVYIDYPNQKIYYSLPSLGVLMVHDAPNAISPAHSLLFVLGTYNSSEPILQFKFDNFIISAVDNVPLSTQDFISDKFNLYPNPSNNIINITNSENIGVEEIKLYDINGKLIETKTYDMESTIQLDVSAFAAGTYLLHIYTTDGTAVKKVIKN